MRFASGAFFFLTTTLALAGCLATEPSPADVSEEQPAVSEEPVAESPGAIQGQQGQHGQNNGNGNACAHPRCEIGDPLDADCHPCVEDICAVDSFCCDVYWDGLCVSEVETVCGKQCNNKNKCGDGTCQGNEDCSTCPTDCGFCPAQCGNLWCELGEDCNNCAQDCGACPFCGDGWCNWGVEDCNNCSQDCGACPVCGDGVCTWDETCDTCSQDCGACSVCGDAVCSWDEGCWSCAQDCGACSVCGDGTCSAGYESCDSCPQDCTTCSCNDECVVGPPQMSSCSPCVALVCAQDMFCCNYQWDQVCIIEAQSLCGLTCPP
jgi:hypothetical protein